MKVRYSFFIFFTNLNLNWLTQLQFKSFTICQIICGLKFIWEASQLCYFCYCLSSIVEVIQPFVLVNIDIQFIAPFSSLSRGGEQVALASFLFIKPEGLPAWIRMSKLVMKSVLFNIFGSFPVVVHGACVVICLSWCVLVLHYLFVSLFICLCVFIGCFEIAKIFMISYYK